jgi:hypothetical protein
MLRQICSPMWRGFLLVFALIIVLSGCSWFKKSSAHENSLYSATSLSLPVDSGKIFHKEKLKKGGKVAVLSFTAGENVEADEELDKIVLMIIRGISDSFEGSSLNVVFEDDAKNADFVIEGHVTKMLSPSKLKRWVMQKKKIELAVEGKMLEAKTNQTLAVFTDSEKAKSNRGDYKQMAFVIGQNIGKFLRQEIE